MSSNTKHTPGPWVVCVDSMDNFLTVEQDREALPDGEEPAVVAQIEDMGNGIDRATGEANAALIAAAPDLLAALLHIVNDTPTPGDDAVLTVNGYNMACAAIARAEGR